MKLIKNHFSNAKIGRIETRVYPVSHAGIICFLHLMESLLEKTPVFHPFLTYNVAIIKNFDKS